MAEINAELRHQMIAKAAYFRAARRGFSGGDPIVDWLEAEAEVDAQLREPDNSPDGFEEQLAVVTEWLKALKKKLADARLEARDEWEADVEKLVKLRRRFQRRIGEAREQGERAGASAKRQAEKIWEEIADIIERASARRPGSSR